MLTIEIELIEIEKNYLSKHYKEISDLIRERSEKYIWNRDEFQLPPISHLDNCSMKRKSLDIGGCIEEEWKCVKILKEVSSVHKEIICRIWDSNGEFILGEIADTLPESINDDNGEPLIFFHMDRLIMIRNSKENQLTDKSKWIELDEFAQEIIRIRLRSMTTDCFNRHIFPLEIPKKYLKFVNSLTEKDYYELMKRLVISVSEDRENEWNQQSIIYNEDMETIKILTTKYNYVNLISRFNNVREIRNFELSKAFAYILGKYIREKKIDLSHYSHNDDSSFVHYKNLCCNDERWLEISVEELDSYIEHIDTSLLSETGEEMKLLIGKKSIVNEESNQTISSVTKQNVTNPYNRLQPKAISEHLESKLVSHLLDNIESIFKSSNSQEIINKIYPSTKPSGMIDENPLNHFIEQCDKSIREIFERKQLEEMEDDHSDSSSCDDIDDEGEIAKILNVEQIDDPAVDLLTSMLTQRSLNDGGEAICASDLLTQNASSL
ncbi:hypothetical protein SNEBB_001300 [Seison nebaliae]|nr:hypothetical protein SNEBB_001300 [Seison nebaliae]